MRVIQPIGERSIVVDPLLLECQSEANKGGKLYWLPLPVSIESEQADSKNSQYVRARHPEEEEHESTDEEEGDALLEGRVDGLAAQTFNGEEEHVTAVESRNGQDIHHCQVEADHGQKPVELVPAHAVSIAAHLHDTDDTAHFGPLWLFDQSHHHAQTMDHIGDGIVSRFAAFDERSSEGQLGRFHFEGESDTDLSFFVGGERQLNVAAVALDDHWCVQILAGLQGLHHQLRRIGLDTIDGDNDVLHLHACVTSDCYLLVESSYLSGGNCIHLADEEE